MYDTAKIISLIDYTTLTGEETQEQIKQFCAEAHSPKGSVAAICVYPKYVAAVKQNLAAKPLPVASVVNFPSGDEELSTVLGQIEEAIAGGADEIDLVLPYKALQKGEYNYCLDFVSACRKACAGKVLKLIIESGELSAADCLKASELGLEAGTDFLKTSTGKVPNGATLEAARIMLEAIKNSGKDCGFKASGGVRSLEDAQSYLNLTEQIMGASWISAKNFRFGASGLLSNLLGAEAQGAAKSNSY